jgi:hypothetical protein
MKTWLIVGGVAVLLVVILVVAFSGSGGEAPKKPTASGSSVSMNPADAIQVQLDARTKSTLAVKILSTRNDLKQLLAMDPVDADAAKTQLKAYDDLAAEVDRGKAELTTRGMPPTEFNTWLVNNHWDEVEAAAKELSSKVAAQAQAQGQ